MNETRQCPNCGRIPPAGARFCPDCRQPLPEAPASPQTASTQTVGAVSDGGAVAGNIAAQGGDVHVGGSQHDGDVVHGRKVDTGGGPYIETYIEKYIPLPPGETYQPPPLPAADELPKPGGLPPGSRLPYPRNAVFTGREAELLEVAGALLHGEGGPLAVTQAIGGWGGVGKTQLAVELCYRYGRYTHGVHWIDASGTPELNRLEAEIAACGLAMGLPLWPETQPEQVAATLKAWAQQPLRLVVLDNLEAVGVLEAALARLEGVRLLVTSRRGSWPAHLGVRSWALGVLERGESVALLRKLAPGLADQPQAALEAVAERYGDLPLGLHVAGSYLRESGLAPEAYLAALARRGGALRHAPLPEWARSSPTGHELDLWATFMLSWERLKPEDESDRLARRAFRMAGYCAANAVIPWEVFERALGEEAEEGAARLALGRLEGLGLAERGEGGLRLHPLLAEFARALDEAEGERALGELAQALVDISDEALERGLPQGAAGLRPHLEAVAEAAERAGLEKAGALWNNLGYYLKMVADYVGAKAAYERALRLDEAAFGPEHPQVAIAVNNLGRVLQDLGDLAGARAHFERALRLDEAAFGPEHPNVARDVNNLGMVLQALGDLAGTRAHLERALRLFEKFLPPEHPYIRTVRGNLEALEG